MSTHNICFRGEIRKIFTGYPLLSRPISIITIEIKCYKNMQCFILVNLINLMLGSIHLAGKVGWDYHFSLILEHVSLISHEGDVMSPYFLGQIHACTCHYTCMVHVMIQLYRDNRPWTPSIEI